MRLQGIKAWWRVGGATLLLSAGMHWNNTQAADSCDSKASSSSANLWHQMTDASLSSSEVRWMFSALRWFFLFSLSPLFFLVWLPSECRLMHLRCKVAYLCLNSYSCRGGTGYVSIVLPLLRLLWSADDDWTFGALSEAVCWFRRKKMLSRPG